jgi:hypothetical protein
MFQLNDACGTESEMKTDFIIHSLYEMTGRKGVRSESRHSYFFVSMRVGFLLSLVSGCSTEWDSL